MMNAGCAAEGDPFWWASVQALRLARRDLTR
eukprot:CAMPEP_0167781784 /NCGR_PEP_ID=MMETSP0111_2-20121227/6131_1 /TAXON_ID=91324 /ORGANISM="Lotharella globosa, Strain CCCM811" /LENGTH=30 /DNA_ID= /DNA_START= /DNA_END= /DNA_ORIENTATION=